MGLFMLTKFQESDVICVVWKVWVDNDLADLDVLPEGSGEEIYERYKTPSFFYVFATVMKSQDDGKGIRWEQLFSVTFLGL